MIDWNRFMADRLSKLDQSDYCSCNVLKEDCTHPNCGDNDKSCPACNQKPCTCSSECESCGA